MRRKPAPQFNPTVFFAKPGRGKTLLKACKNDILFSQGDNADTVFYIQEGNVKLSVVSTNGKEAVIAMLDRTSFFGEDCLAGQPSRLATATALDAATIVRIEKTAMVRMLHDDPTLSALFMAYLLSHNLRIEEDLVDHLFNCSEKRLARVLLLMARFGKEGQPQTVIARIHQGTLAVSFFMNKFRKLGFIDYSNGEMHVHSSLLNVVLHD